MVTKRDPPGGVSQDRANLQEPSGTERRVGALVPVGSRRLYSAQIFWFCSVVWAPVAQYLAGILLLRAKGAARSRAAGMADPG